VRAFRTIALATVTLLTAACSFQYKMVGKFDAYNEVIVGDLDHNPAAGVAQIDATGENSGIRCTGSSRVTYVPPFSLGCAGQQGTARLRCDDGRVAHAEWTANSCTSGFGYGQLTDGSSFSFTFGLTEEEARASLAEMRPQVASKPNLPVYRPRETRQENGFNTGTGFFVTRSGHLVTNFHVVQDAETVQVQIGDKLIEAEKVHVDPANDVALLKLDIATEALPIAGASRLERADEVFTLGYPSVDIQGQAQKATFGRVNSLSGIMDDIRFLQVDVPVQPGNSGGPLINKRGEVVGVVTMTLDSLVTLRETGALPQNVNYAVKTDYVMPLLKGIDSWEERPQRKELEFKDLAARYRQSVVLVVAR